VPKILLQERYYLGNITIDQILAYKALKQKHANKIGKPKKLTNAQVDIIIKYCSKNYK
jgi:hypothetical protein